MCFFSQPGYYFIYLFPRQDLAPTVRYQDSIRCVELLAHYWLYVVSVKCRHAWPLHSFLGHWRHYHAFSKTRFLYVPFRSRDHHALLICSFGTNHSILIFIVRPCLYRWLVARVQDFLLRSSYSVRWVWQNRNINPILFATRVRSMFDRIYDAC